MKKNKFTLGWFFISLLMAFAVTACDDEDDNVATVTFPEKQKFDVYPEHLPGSNLPADSERSHQWCPGNGGCIDDRFVQED